jgi:hypothetical protein
MDDEKAEDENPLLGWPRSNRTSNVRDGLFVTDAEFIRRLGLGERPAALFFLPKAPPSIRSPLPASHRVRCSAASQNMPPCAPAVVVRR